MEFPQHNNANPEVQVQNPVVGELYQNFMAKALTYLMKQSLLTATIVQNLVASSLETTTQDEAKENLDVEPGISTNIAKQLHITLPTERIVAKIDLATVAPSAEISSAAEIDFSNVDTIAFAEMPSLRKFVSDNWKQLRTADELKESYLQLFNMVKTLDSFEAATLSKANVSLWDTIHHNPLNLDLQEIVETQRNFNPSPGIIEKQYQKFETFLLAPTLTYKTFHVLSGVALVEVDNITLDENISIRYTSATDKHFFWREPVLPILEQNELLIACLRNPILEVTYTYPKEVGRLDFSPLDTKISEVLLALRLYKPTYPIGSTATLTYNPDYPTYLPMPIHHYENKAFGKLKLELNQEASENFTIFWTKFKELVPFITEKLAVAVGRFTSSYQQKEPANRLLDLVIGLESIFSETPDSITYKYALRGAVATATTQEERLTIFSDLKLSYSVRSNIAHGGGGSGKSVAKKVRDILEVRDERTVEEFIGRLRVILGRAILRLARWHKDNLKNKKSSAEFLEELDNAMLLTEKTDLWVM